MRKKYYLFLTFLLTLAMQFSFAQAKNITGVVKEVGTGESLPGVNVIVKGTTNGVSTDFDGKYTIKAKPGQTLIFSFLGYKTVSKKVGNNNVINVNLKEENEMLTAVTINALGIEVKKASQKAIAISNVKAKTLLSSGESDPVAALSGKVSGVNINLSSGDPGASTNITIRGPKSILLSNKPLFVVDGIPIVDDIYGSGVAGVERPSKISDIDPNNIESIKILKGGSAAAIWGSKGANGVVLITTKKGKRAKKGQFDVTVSSSFSVDNALTKFPLQDKYGQGSNGNYVPNYDFFKESGSWGDKIADRSGSDDMTLPDLYFLDQDGKKWEFILQKNSRETYNKKNYDAVIGTGNMLRNSVQISTATDKARYFLGFNHLDQTGIFANSYYKKIGLNYNSIMKPNKKLTISTNVQYSNTKQNAIQKGSNLSGLLLGLYRTPADFDNSGYFGERHAYGIVSKYSQRSYRQPAGTSYKGGLRDPNNSAGYNNPLFTVYKQKNPYYTNHIITGTNFSHKTLEWLKLTAKAGVDYANEKADEYMPINSAGAVSGSYSTYIYSYLQISGDLIAQINTQISDDITADILLGYNVFHKESDYNSSYYYDFILPTDVPSAGNAVNEKKYPGFGTSVRKKNSGYGTATISYKDLLYTTLTGRVERSSAYYGLISYPSVSLAFDVHNLEYFKKQDSDLLNQLTLRASWSKVGNEPPSYLLDTYYNPAADGDGYGSYWSASDYGGAFWRSNLKGNKDLKPEITTELEFGADIKMFDHRLSLNASYYNSKSDDLILYEKVPAATGYLYKWNNVAAMTNKGYELEASYKIIHKSELNLTLGGTYSHNKNMVTKLKGSDYIGLDGFISTSSGVAEGHGYGILRSGDFERDANGLVLDDNGFPKKGKLIYAGDPNPDFKASAYTNFSYKNFSLRILADGSFGGQSWDGTYGALTFFGRTLETANEVTVDGNIVNSEGNSVISLVHNGNISGIDNGDGSFTVRGNVQDFGAGPVLLDQTWYTNLGGGFGPVGTQFFKDATWIKLRELTAGYTFKGKAFGMSKIKSVYFGITGRNLYLWTKDNWSIDPESNLSGSSKGRGLQYFNHPTTKSIIFRTTISF